MQEPRKHEQLGDFGGIPGAPSGPPAIPLTDVPLPAEAPQNAPESSEPKRAFSNHALPVHEAAHFFPPMTESEYLDLRESISSIGQTDPIWIFEGKVIDGRHRLRACTELGIEPKLREWDGKGSLLEFVVATNLKRRHLKEPQRALIAAQLAEAHHLTESQSLQDKELSDRANLPSPISSGPMVSNVPMAQATSLEQAGILCNVSRRSVVSANRVVKMGAPELVDMVTAGQFSISAAADLAELPQERQRQLLTQGREAISAAIKSIRDERERAKRAAEGKIPLRPEPSDIEVLDSFRIGKARLIKTQRRFRLDLSDRWFRELEDLAEWPHFQHLLERGLLITIKKPKDVA